MISYPLQTLPTFLCGRRLPTATCPSQTPTGFYPRGRSIPYVAFVIFAAVFLHQPPMVLLARSLPGRWWVAHRVRLTKFSGDHTTTAIPWQSAAGVSHGGHRRRRGNVHHSGQADVYHSWRVSPIGDTRSVSCLLGSAAAGLGLVGGHAAEYTSEKQARTQRPAGSREPAGAQNEPPGMKSEAAHELVCWSLRSATPQAVGQESHQAQAG